MKPGKSGRAAKVGAQAQRFQNGCSLFKKFALLFKNSALLFQNSAFVFENFPSILQTEIKPQYFSLTSRHHSSA